MQCKFPTNFHKKTFNLAVEFLKTEKDVLALSLTGACAREEGSYDSDIDLEIFTKNIDTGKTILEKFDEFKSTLGTSSEVGKYFDIDLCIGLADIKPIKRSWTDGPDNFELEIGNRFAYSQLIFERDDYFTKAKAKYFPYYDENLRQEKLKETIKFCENNIGHIEPYIRRGLYFQAFKRLYDASKEFLQALFIHKKIYPIAYDKWVKKQIVEILQLPELYKDFVSLYEISNLESDELMSKGEKLHNLLNQHINI
ncbi:MAG: hypothetical protein M1127_00190 [Patescibacteria group bacterium]|nr:hypothetical protein [Patescibacteria group bacterium]